MSGVDEALRPLRAGELAGATRVALACGLTEFPRELFALADSLEILDLSGNALDALPEDLHRLHRLRVLFCSSNRFTTLPASLGACARLEMIGFKANRIARVPAEALPPRLRWLILTDNDIAELPDALGERPRLQKLMLAGNRLDRLPDTLAGAGHLELLRIAANRFERLPPWLATLPRLAWLAFGGNPLGRAREDAALDAHALPRIDAADLALRERLGEGASGVIRRALWSRGDGATDGAPLAIAVKHFKGAMTSDGTPRSERAACIAAGDHPGLIGALATVEADAAGEGLALRLIDPAFGVLAGPPSLDSCTRDVYAADLRLAPAQALGIARDIAAAAAHLHARGLLHGDLYAHNILWRRDAPDAGIASAGGIALLGDFGAASFVADAADAAALERIEVRAFGCLLEELAGHCDADAGAVPALTAMRMLQARCLRGDAAMRPGFAEIDAALRALRIG
ncbi:leucine-rich repeat domain-containing protein [Variovorax sp. PvP013]|uniref:leucine-rich repeat domain-containing protein n=1 Tax=Variovorax sp. PvP013 TaxID=3156435 RepID=UPI003D25857A